MRRWLLALIITATCETLLQGQQQERFPSPPPGTTRDFLTAVALMSPDSAAQVEILFRCNSRSLVALRSDDPAAPYLRKGELTVELFDSTGTSHARDIERIEIPVQAPDTSTASLSWIEQRISFQVPPGRYQVRAELQDLQSRNRLLRTTQILNHPLLRDSLRAIPVFFLTNDTSTADDTLRPQNFGEGVLFASPGSILFQIPDADTTSLTASVSVKIFVQDPGSTTPALLREEQPANLPLWYRRRLSPIDGVNYVLRLQPGPARGAFLLVPMPLDKLPLRRYRIEFHIIMGTRHARVPVNAVMIWPDQPESLRDVDYALESLRFIAPEHLLDSLQRGNFEARRDKLEGFWKKQGSTPGTAENPLMTEYYRRVDYAREQFATLRQNDGTRTDRGRIYILNGPPSRTERTLDPVNGFTETWTYDRTRKRFVFLDKNRDGNYTLVTSGTL